MMIAIPTNLDDMQDLARIISEHWGAKYSMQMARNEIARLNASTDPLDDRLKSALELENV